MMFSRAVSGVVEGKSLRVRTFGVHQLDFGVDAFGAAVVLGVGKGGVDGVAVLVESSGEGVQVGQVLGACFGDPAGEKISVVGGGGEQAAAKERTRPGGCLDLRRT